MTSGNKPFYIRLLGSELQRRKLSNPRYSLKGFARLLGITAPTLSRIINRKRSLSPTLAKQIAEKLGLGPTEAVKFLKSIVEVKSGNFIDSTPELDVGKIRDLEITQMDVISDWVHFAIIEYTQLIGVATDAPSIAQRLGVSIERVEKGIQNLLKLELILRGDDGRLVKTSNYISTRNPEQTSVALKDHQRQCLQKSLEALESIPIKSRIHSSLMLPIDPTKIERARALLEEYKREFTSVMSRSSTTEVYCLHMSFFPLTVSENIPKVKL